MRPFLKRIWHKKKGHIKTMAGVDTENGCTEEIIVDKAYTTIVDGKVV